MVIFNDEEPIVHEIQQAQPDFIFVAFGISKTGLFHRPSPVYCQFDLDGRRRQFRRFDRQRSTGPLNFGSIITLNGSSG